MKRLLLMLLLADSACKAGVAAGTRISIDSVTGDVGDRVRSQLLVTGEGLDAVTAQLAVAGIVYDVAISKSTATSLTIDLPAEVANLVPDETPVTAQLVVTRGGASATFALQLARGETGPAGAQGATGESASPALAAAFASSPAVAVSGSVLSLVNPIQVGDATVHATGTSLPIVVRVGNWLTNCAGPPGVCDFDSKVIGLYTFPIWCRVPSEGVSACSNTGTPPDVPFAFIPCPSGHQVVGGGCVMEYATNAILSTSCPAIRSADGGVACASGPMDPGLEQGWACSIVTHPSASVWNAQRVSAQAVCLKALP